MIGAVACWARGALQWHATHVTAYVIPNRLSLNQNGRLRAEMLF